MGDLQGLKMAITVLRRSIRKDNLCRTKNVWITDFDGTGDDSGAVAEAIRLLVGVGLPEGLQSIRRLRQLPQARLLR